jgi:hypothetical protein
MSGNPTEVDRTAPVLDASPEAWLGHLRAAAAGA